jgi:hypothetical protein
MIFFQTQTKYGTEEKVLIFNTSHGILNKTVQVVTKAVGHARGTNLIGESGFFHSF